MFPGRKTIAMAFITYLLATSIFIGACRQRLGTKEGKIAEKGSNRFAFLGGECASIRTRTAVEFLGKRRVRAASIPTCGRAYAL